MRTLLKKVNRKKEEKKKGHCLFSLKVEKTTFALRVGKNTLTRPTPQIFFPTLSHTSAAEDAEELIRDVPTSSVLSKVENIVELKGVALLVEVALAIDHNENTAREGRVAVNILRLEGALLEGEGGHTAHDGGGALHLLTDPRHEGGLAVDAGELGAVGHEDLIVLVDETFAYLVEGHDFMGFSFFQ